MQVLTACLKSFAHGANDTANAAGPFAAVQSLYLSNAGCESITTPFWVLAFCGFGIVVVSILMQAVQWFALSVRMCHAGHLVSSLHASRACQLCCVFFALHLGSAHRAIWVPFVCYRALRLV